MASSKKIRKEKLSIYLARDCHKPISELIRLDNVKRPILLDLPDTELAELYIKIQPPQIVPPWTKIFTDSNQVESQEFGTSSNVGAVLVVRLTGSTFVLSFGTGFHLIKQEAIERDFGLKMTPSYAFQMNRMILKTMIAMMSQVSLNRRE